MPIKILTKTNFSEFIPEKAIPFIINWIYWDSIAIRLSKPRSTKLGDFFARQHTSPVISINNNLNKYEFLITLAHEYAHFLHWKEHKWSRKPHGKRWKNHYVTLLLPMMQAHIFPSDIQKALLSFIENPTASANTHTLLTQTLCRYNAPSELVPLEALPIFSVFEISNGKVFVKGEKQRKRYKCTCKNNQRIYYVNASTLVKKIDLD